MSKHGPWPTLVYISKFPWLGLFSFPKQAALPGNNRISQSVMRADKVTSDAAPMALISASVIIPPVSRPPGWLWTHVSRPTHILLTCHTSPLKFSIETRRWTAAGGNQSPVSTFVVMLLIRHWTRILFSAHTAFQHVHPFAQYLLCGGQASNHCVFSLSLPFLTISSQQATGI